LDANPFQALGGIFQCLYCSITEQRQRNVKQSVVDIYSRSRKSTGYSCNLLRVFFDNFLFAP